MGFFPPQTAKLSHCFHTVSLICQKHITPSISKKQKSKLNSNFHLRIFLWGEKGCIHFRYYFMYIKKWPQIIDSLNLFKNHKIYLRKEHYILHTALKGRQGHVDDQVSPPFKKKKKITMYIKQGVHNSYRKTITIYHQQWTKIKSTLCCCFKISVLVLCGLSLPQIFVIN